jgi:hypothetical protein
MTIISHPLSFPHRNALQQKNNYGDVLGAAREVMCDKASSKKMTLLFAEYSFCAK